LNIYFKVRDLAIGGQAAGIQLSGLVQILKEGPFFNFFPRLGMLHDGLENSLDAGMKVDDQAQFTQFSDLIKSTARGNNGVTHVFTQPVCGALLQFTEAGLAMNGENIANFHLDHGLDEIVGVNGVETCFFRQSARGPALAHTHETDQDDIVRLCHYLIVITIPAHRDYRG